LNEDPIIALRRTDLEDRISRLSKIKTKLDQFWGDRVPNFDLEENSASEVPALPVESMAKGKKKKRSKNSDVVEDGWLTLSQ